MRYIISGGGTGGHIFPAIAIANALGDLDKEAEILFIGAKGRMEMEKVPEAGYKIEGLWISGLQRRLTYKNISFPFKVVGSLLKALQIVKSFKPDVAIGVGGYASGPTLRVSAFSKVPCVIQEQNSYPGITNKVLARRAEKICVAYEGMEKFFNPSKIVFTGNPVRQSITQCDKDRNEILQELGLDSGKPVLLVVGGSLGARTINHSIAASVQLFAEHGIQVLWQTGKLYIDEANQIIRQHNLHCVKAFSFISAMNEFYKVSDMIVSRAGAIAISELCLIGKPAILIPSPNVAEDHQTKNAMALVNKDAAMLIRDSEAVEKLGTLVVNLFKDEGQRYRFGKNISKLAKPNASNDIAWEIIKLAQQKKK